MILALKKHADGRQRCSWCGDQADYIHYHDTEWGRPVRDDQRLYEKITLEGFQSGLSWITILRKRDAFREGFAGFDFHKVAQFDEKDVLRLLGNVGIVRHRGKIEAAINNAQRVCDFVSTEGPFAEFIWQFKPEKKNRPAKITPAVAATLTQSPESLALSKALKAKGFKFVGPTTMYAFMQSMGLVNDHLDGCDSRAACDSGGLQ
jgi:DNA-3-methyladenine glycosylase I